MSAFPFDANESIDGVTVLYDGECHFCSAYVRMVKLREAVGEVRLVDARVANDPIVQEVTSRGFDLNEGMALLIGERIYYGSDCLHVLALLTSGGSFLNRLNARLFRSRSLARYAYPILRAGRNLTLRLLGRGRIGSDS